MLAASASLAALSGSFCVAGWGVEGFGLISESIALCSKEKSQNANVFTSSNVNSFSMSRSFSCVVVLSLPIGF